VSQPHDLHDAARESEVSAKEVDPTVPTELYEDVKAIDKVGNSLLPVAKRPPSGVAAAERGRRQRPDGTVEEYERIEFRSTRE
jgi:hypothetical protein